MGVAEMIWLDPTISTLSTIVAIVSTILCPIIAHNKGRSVVGWFFGGLFLNGLGLIIISCLSSKKYNWPEHNTTRVTHTPHTPATKEQDTNTNNFNEYRYDSETILKIEALRVEKIYTQALERVAHNPNDQAFTQSINELKTIRGYRDVDNQIEMLIARKEEWRVEQEKKRIENIYTQALARVAHEPNDWDFTQSINELKTIPGYRDADDQIAALTVRLEEWREAKAKADELRRIQLEEELKKKRRIGKICLLCALGGIVFIILLFTLIIPFARYCKADRLVNEGSITKAESIYVDLGSFLDSKHRRKVLEGIRQVDHDICEEGIVQLLEQGVPVKITYHMEGGTLDGVTDETVEYSYQSSAEFTKLQVPQRDGYQFTAWVCNDYYYQDGETFAADLYAVWEAKSYDISYNLQSSMIVNHRSSYKSTDDSFTLPIPEKRGYAFIGWTGTDLQEPTISVTIPKGSFGDREYTANWEEVSYTITLDPNGGTVSENSITVKYGRAYALPTPTRAGYTFNGWYIGDIKLTGGLWTRSSGATVTASWVESDPNNMVQDDWTERY